MGEDNEESAPDRQHLRASDAERDAVAARLREALAEGRLDPDEHSERLDAVYNAKTQGELEPLLADLPGPGAGAVPATRPDGSPRPIYGAERVVDAQPTSQNAVAIMSGADRTGEWVVPETFTALSVMGGVGIDLREARFTARETTIYAHSLMGAVEVQVPDDVIVRVDGVGFMGGYWLDGDQPSVTDPGAPVVNVKGVAFMGSVTGVYKPRKHQEPKKKSWWAKLRKELED